MIFLRLVFTLKQITKYHLDSPPLEIESKFHPLVTKYIIKLSKIHHLEKILDTREPGINQ